MLGGGEACAPKDLDEKMEHSRLHYCQIIECGVGVWGRGYVQRNGKGREKKIVESKVNF